MIDPGGSSAYALVAAEMHASVVSCGEGDNERCVSLRRRPSASKSQPLRARSIRRAAVRQAWPQAEADVPKLTALRGQIERLKHPLRRSLLDPVGRRRIGERGSALVPGDRDPLGRSCYRQSRTDDEPEVVGTVGGDCRGRPCLVQKPYGFGSCRPVSGNGSSKPDRPASCLASGNTFRAPMPAT